jgi:hypothetical protein
VVLKRAWRDLHPHVYLLRKKQCNDYSICSMRATPFNGKHGRSESGTQKSTDGIWLEKIQSCLGVPLACQIGASATSSNMNGNATTINAVSIVGHTSNP